MNKQIKKLWIKALRSGKYEQGRGALRSDGLFCCLGVLCDLHRQQFHKRWKRNEVDTFEYDGDGFILPKTVQEWAEIPNGDPRLGEYHAAQLNDDGNDFNFIADRIEKYL